MAPSSTFPVVADAFKTVARHADSGDMGAQRRGRVLTLLAAAMVVLAPSIAVAKTLEATKTGSEPLQTAVSGPPATGTVAPMIVPPSTVTGPGSVFATVGAGADTTEESDTGDASAAGRGPESGLPIDSARTSPVASTSSTGGNQPTAAWPVGAGNTGSTNAGPTTTRLTSPLAAPRPAGQSIPLPPDTDGKPSAFALRDQPATASSGASAAGAAGAEPNSISEGPPGSTAPSPSAPSAVAPRQDGTGSFVSCATLPSPGLSNDRMIWTSGRTAEITAGRDLRTAERVSALPGTSVTWDRSSPVEAYVLHADTFAVMARFTASGGGSDEPVGFLDQPLPGLLISECDGRPAPGIAPGTYLLRYAFKGTVTSASTVASEIFVSPSVSVRVIAGPTAPAPAAAPAQ